MLAIARLAGPGGSDVVTCGREQPEEKKTILSGDISHFAPFGLGIGEQSLILRELKRLICCIYGAEPLFVYTRADNADSLRRDEFPILNCIDEATSMAALVL